MRALGLAALLIGCSPPGIVDPPDVADADCTVGCASPARDDGSAAPTASEYQALVDQWLQEPIDAPTLPLETLLFHGPHTVRAIEALPLPADRRAFLLHELARDRAAVEVRLVDAAGVVRAHLDANGLALGEGTHLHMHDTGTLGAIEMSGRVRRVGLGHLWSRW